MCLCVHLCGSEWDGLVLNEDVHQEQLLSSPQCECFFNLEGVGATARLIKIFDTQAQKNIVEAQRSSCMA